MGISEYDNFNPIFLKISENLDNVKMNYVEKNWMPLVPNSSSTEKQSFIYLVYQLDPLIVLKYDFNRQGMCDVVHVQKDITSKMFMRGSTKFVHLKDQYYISAIHSRIYTDVRYYYLPYFCILDINSWKIVYVSDNILFKCDENDSITKIDGTNIMIYSKTLSYLSNDNNNVCYISHCINYPGSIQKLESSTDSNMEFIMTAQLNGPTLKYKVSFDMNVILEKIKANELNNLANTIDWDDKVKNQTIKFIETVPYNQGVPHRYFFDH
jgi:hypothetical protein